MKTKVFDRLRDVPEDTWNKLAQRQACIYSRDFWKIAENSGLNDFRYRFALVSDETGRPVALAGFYTVTTDIAIFAPLTLRNLLAKVRRLFPNFFKLRMLECGNPICVSSPPFATIDREMNGKIIATLAKLLQEIARTEGHLLIVIRDFEPEESSLQADLEQCGYHWVDCFPNTYMDIIWETPELYIASLKSYYRSKLLKYLRRNEQQQVHHELRNDFHDLADTLCRQWMVVHEHADEYQREVLTPSFYREFSQRLGDRSKVLLFYRRGVLVGHALLLLDGDLLRWMYFGRNQAGNDNLYIYVGYTVIETAIRLGARRLQLGLTTYAVKRDLGATITPIYLAISSSRRFLNPLVGFLYPILNRPPRLVNKRVFKA